MTTQQLIPNTLRIQREQAGLRQIDVAQFLGLSSTDRISHWEKGVAFPHLLNLFKLSALYKILPHELYGELFKNISEEVSRRSQDASSPPEP